MQSGAKTSLVSPVDDALAVGGEGFEDVVSGIGGECFSWMGGGQQCGDRVAAHLGAGRAGGDTTRMCQWSGTALWARRNWRQR